MTRKTLVILAVLAVALAVLVISTEAMRGGMRGGSGGMGGSGGGIAPVPDGNYGGNYGGNYDSGNYDNGGNVGNYDSGNYDNGGNVGNCEGNFEPDTTLPTITIDSPQNTTYTTTSSVDLNYSVGDESGTDWVGYSLDGQANVTTSGEVTNFSDSSGGDLGTATNITFDQAESNVSVYLRIPKNSTVINASMNIIGYKGWQSDNAIALGITGSYSDSPKPEAFQMGSTWYLLVGRGLCCNPHPKGYNWTGSTWQSDSAIASGILLGEYALLDYSSPTVFQMGSTWYLISGAYNGSFFGFNWTGSTWQSDSAITAGLGDLDGISSPSAFQMGSTWYLISGNSTGTGDSYVGYNWTGSTWQSDSAIVSGLVEDTSTVPAVFQKDSTWYLVVANNSIYYGFNWTGSTWQSDTAISFGLTASGFLHSMAFQMNNTWYLISGVDEGVFYGFNMTDIPTNLSIDTANDSIIDWNLTGELNSTNPPQNIALNTTAIQNYVDTNNANANGYVYVPLNFTSDRAGIVQLDALSVKYYSNATLTNLSDGTHNVTVYANDTTGKTSSSTVWFTVAP